MKGPVHYKRVPLRRYARRFQDGGAVDGTMDPYYEPLAASAGIAPAGPTPVGSAMLQGAVDWAAAPGRTVAQRQPQAGEMWSDEDEAIRQANAAGEAGWGAQTAMNMVGTPGGAGGLGSGIRAYHGSPHDFERFDLSKIGTGEGAQVYGHGLYFAENPAVAEDYKQSLSRAGPWEWDGKPLRRDTEADVPSHVWHALGWLEGNQRPGESVAELIHRRIRDLSDHAEFMRRSSNPADRSAAGMYDSTVETLRRLDASKLKAPAGKMYEVDINADPEHFLDWDRPLSEQHPKVREALFNSGIVKKDIGQPAAAIAKALADTPEGASALREAGIPGIRYLDQHSRWATDMKLGDVAPQTHNYVVFDDSLIDIIKKYGLAGLIAAGAAHFTAPADNAHGMARGGAAEADDGALTEEELAQVNRAWRGLIEDQAHRGQMHYTMPDVRGMPAPGSFRIPKDVFAALGDGDLKLGGAVVHSMFGIEDDPEDPTLVHPHAVRIIGNGSLAAGRKVLERFVQQVRRSAAGRGWRVEEGEDGVVLHHRRSGSG